MHPAHDHFDELFPAVLVLQLSHPPSTVGQRPTQALILQLTSSDQLYLLVVVRRSLQPASIVGQRPTTVLIMQLASGQRPRRLLRCTDVAAVHASSAWLQLLQPPSTVGQRPTTERILKVTSSLKFYRTLHCCYGETCVQRMPTAVSRRQWD